MWMMVLSTGGRLSIVGHWAEIGIPSINIRAKMEPPLYIHPGRVIDQVHRDRGRQEHLLRFTSIDGAEEGHSRPPRVLLEQVFGQDKGLFETDTTMAFGPPGLSKEIP